MLSNVRYNWSNFDLLSLLFALFLGTCVIRYFRPKPETQLPLINGTRWFDWIAFPAKLRFLYQSDKFLKEGFKASPSGFYITAFNGQRLVLPPQFADELRNNAKLSARKAAQQEFLTHKYFLGPLNGDPMTDRTFDRCILRVTRSINYLSEPISEESRLSLRRQWTDSSEWVEIPLVESTMHLIAQISSRAFVGQPLCRNPRWIDAVSRYAAVGFSSATILHLFPAILHPILEMTLPSCRQARAHIKTAAELLNPILKERETQSQQPDDAITWLRESAEGSYYDPVIAIFGLLFASVPSTSDFLSKLLIDLCEHPDLIPPLREEMISVIGTHGMNKESIDQLRLLDSVMKESQRLKPAVLVTMGRLATDSFTLSNGVEVPRGTYTSVASTGNTDPCVYDDPNEFDGYRFLRMRECPGQDHHGQFVTTGPNSMGFGHGTHACSGRFFAAHEAKILLCHILLEYELKLAPQYTPLPAKLGWFVTTDPGVKLLVKRRTPELLLP